MASNFFPMLSSSPPPIDDNDCFDDEDDFGTFTSANACFDSFDSPVSGENIKPINVDCRKDLNDGIKSKNEEDHLNNDNALSPDEFSTSIVSDDIKKVSCNSHSNHVKKELSEEECYLNKTIPFVEEQATTKILCSSFKSTQDGKIDMSDDEFSISSKITKSPLNCKQQEDRDCMLSDVDVCNCSTENTFQIVSKLNCSCNCSDSNEFNSENISSASKCELGENLENSINLKSKEVGIDITDYPHVYDKNLSPDLEEINSHSVDNSFEEFENFQVDFNNVKDFQCDDFPKENLHLKTNCDIEKNNIDSLSFQNDHYHNQRTCTDISSMTVAFENIQSDPVESEKYSCDFPNLANPDHSSQLKETDQFCNFQNLENPNHTAESDDFEDFQNCEHLNQVSEADDFHYFQNGDDLKYSHKADDFDNFSNHIKKVGFEASNLNQEDDDFDEFQNCEIVHHTQETDDFADFSNVTFSDTSENQRAIDCSEKFANFESAPFSSTSNVPSVSDYHRVSPLSAQEQEKGHDKLSTVMKAIFPLSEENDENFETEGSITEVLEQSTKSRRLWEKLHEVEQTPGLRFQWPISHTFQQLLRSVNVDYHSILRMSSVPIFASGLSILEPMKGPASLTANQDLEDRNQSIRDPIPPVEFDWNGSGLINPLDSVQTTSTLMDLSFLSSASTTTQCSTINDHSFENELLKTTPLPECNKAGSKTLILEQLLSKTVSSLPSSKKAHRPPNISNEASHVLDQLPDINFMQAKVLMFPIFSKT